MIERDALLSPPTINWQDSFPEIIGRSEPIKKVLETVSKISRSDGAVLITGESGTGKELIASAIHRLSERASGKFIPLNCSAIPENLLESELFGHEKGAFTGAVQKRMGHFEMADGGSLFLDEIGDMTPRLQSKLLRVLQDKQFTAVGGSTLRKANVRVIAATNVELDKAVENGVFRLDLFYRLNVLPVSLPPLRERKADIVNLLSHFLENVNRTSRSDCYFSDDTIRTLANYSWPGNVRELQNLVERLVIIKQTGVITRLDLPTEYLVEHVSSSLTVDRPVQTQPLRPDVLPSESIAQEGFDLTSYIEDLENRYIIEALEKTNNNKNKAAKMLGLNRTTLVERIKKRKIAPLKN